MAILKPKSTSYEISPQIGEIPFKRKLINDNKIHDAMDLALVEMKNSWTHCRELIQSHSQLDVVVAFLEDFKEQFTQFYHRVKNIQKNHYQRLSFSLVDKAYLFWTKEGELSQLISYVQANWHKQSYLLKRVELLDGIITAIITQYATVMSSSSHK